MDLPIDVLSAKILIVDDTETNVRLLELLLAGAGYTNVTSEHDSRKVVDLYKTNAYDAVLLDLILPHIDGFQIMGLLKIVEPEPYLPVLVITAEPDHRVRALQAGAQDFISKPYNSLEVLTRLRNMLTVRLLNKNLRSYQIALESRSAELDSANRFLDSVIENIPTMIFIKDARELRHIRVNRACEETIGFPREALVGKTVHELFPKEQADFFEEKDRAALRVRSLIDIEEETISTGHRGERILHTKKVTVLNENGEPTHLLGISEDVTDRIMMEKEIRRLNAALSDRAQHLQVSNDEQQAALNYAALFDILTGAPNRFYFLQTMDRALQSHARTNTSLALVAVNIRNFGRINDSFSKSGGDRLLTMIVERLTEGSQFGCARISANTFAVALSDLNGNSDVAQALYKHVLEPLSRSFLIGGVQLNIACRCGIAVFPADGNNSEELFGNAEAALKSAKDQGEEYLFYTPALNAQVAEQIALESELREAIAGQQFVLYYQSKVESGSGRLIGFEALIRWNSPKRGMVPPVEFIPILEETGMILEVGKWVLRQAANDYLRWRELGLNPPPIAVNISAMQLRRHDFVETVWETCRRDLEYPAAIDLEITESVLMEDIERIIPSLQKLRDAGFGISIDDFGTGYSSFSYLTRIPLTSVKIDRSFINRLAKESSHDTIVSTIILLAHALKLTVVAEGVETEQQRLQLVQMNCDELQGYLFGKPMPEASAAQLLQQNSR